MKSLQNSSEQKKRVNAWENEGGTIVPEARTALPKGIERIVVTRYRVGPYTYDNLSDAIAESRRK